MSSSLVFLSLFQQDYIQFLYVTFQLSATKLSGAFAS